MSTTSTGYLGPMFLFYGLIIGGRFSGGCFNGGIALAVYITNLENYKRNFHILILTILAELLGAYTGIALACTIRGASYLPYMSPAADSTPLFVFYVEMLITFIMISFVM